MNYLKKFSIAACFATALVLIVFSFSGIFAMEQTDAGACVATCENNRQACYNINPDRRLCEEEYKNCEEACKPDDNAAPGQQEGDQGTAPPEKY